MFVGKGRLEALIDAVFAIAMTLLVLDLPTPQHSTRLAHALLEQWRDYAAYLVSFVTVGILWIEHHGMMSAVREVNRRFLERTLLFLLFIALIPWPTGIAAHYAHGGSEASVAAVLYATTMMFMGLSFWAGWRYLAHHPTMAAKPSRGALRAGARRALTGGLVYLVAIAIAPFSSTTSFAIDAIVAIYFAASKSEVPGLIHRAAQTEGGD